MTVKTKCPACFESIEFDHEGIGQRVDCPHCSRSILLQSPKYQPAQRTSGSGQPAWIGWLIGWAVVSALAACAFASETPGAPAKTISDAIWSGVFFGLFFIVAVAIYFAPSIMAKDRRKANAAAIFALNLFLGWSLIGWVVALVWALTVEKPNDSSRH